MQAALVALAFILLQAARQAEVLNITRLAVGVTFEASIESAANQGSIRSFLRPQSCSTSGSTSS